MLSNCAMRGRVAPLTVLRCCVRVLTQLFGFLLPQSPRSNTSRTHVLASYFMDTICELEAEPLDGRLMQHLLSNPLEDVREP